MEPKEGVVGATDFSHSVRSTGGTLDLRLASGGGGAAL